MVGGFAVLDYVVEGLAGRGHGQGADGLANED